MLSQQLIDSALALTSKTMEDMEDIVYTGMTDCLPENTYVHKFSIEKFCYYLLSECFIEKYPGDVNEYISDIPYAIMHYQSGDETLLIELLTKICTQKLY